VKNPRDVILRPVVSEKSYGLLDANVYTFVVAPGASKPEIRDAVEAIWPGVKVAKVNTLVRKGKTKRGRRSAVKTKQPDSKRAIVTLRSGEIEIFQAGA
jgi:large subunit ribosomal protein L23